MLLTCLLVGALAKLRQVPTAPTVETVQEAIATLSPKLARPVEVQKGLRPIPLIVDVTGTTAEATLRTIAFALHASLVQDGRTLRIARTAADDRALQAVQTAARRTRIAQGLTKWDHLLQRASAYGDAADQVREARAGIAKSLQDNTAALQAHQRPSLPAELLAENMVTPVGRLLHGLVGRIGLDRLSGVRDDHPLFLSDRPSSTESPLPEWTDLRAAYVQEQSKFLQAMGSLGAAAPDPRTTILHASLSGIELDLFNADGRRVDHGWISYDMTPILLPGTDRLPVEDGDRTVALDAATQALQIALGTLEPRTEPLRLADLPEGYLDPERFDPLGFAARTGVLALEEEPGRHGFVAVLSDRLLEGADGASRNGSLDLDAFRRWMFGRGGFERVERSGATVVRPADELTAEAERCDRRILGEGIRRVVADRAITTKNWLPFRLALYTTEERPVMWRYLRALARLGLPAFGGFDVDTVGPYALLGFANQTGRRTLDGSVPPLDRLIVDGIVQGWLRALGGTGASDLALMPSRLIARAARAKVEVSTTEIAVARSNLEKDEDALQAPFRGVPAEALGAGEIGVFQQMSRLPRTERRVQRYIDSAILGPRYRLGRRLTLRVDVRFAPEIGAAVEIVDEREERHGLRFQDLPKTFQDGVMRGVQEGPSKPTAGGDPPPPPSGTTD